VASVSYLFDPKARIEILQFSRRFKGNNGAVIADDEQDWDANRAHQLVILRVRRRQNIERTDSGSPSRVGYELDELGPTMRVSDPCLSQHVSLIPTEKLAVLLDDIALVNFALALGAQESGVRQDDPAKGRPDSTRHHGRSHASHRMSQENRSGKSEPLDESNDIARVIVVAIAIERSARAPVPSGVRHHDVVLVFESACQRTPAGAAPGQAMEENQWRLGPSGSQVVDVDAVCFAHPGHPARH
jgi:hypothetical protein